MRDVQAPAKEAVKAEEKAAAVKAGVGVRTAVVATAVVATAAAAVAAVKAAAVKAAAVKADDMAYRTKALIAGGVAVAVIVVAALLFSQVGAPFTGTSATPAQTAQLQYQDAAQAHTALKADSTAYAKGVTLYSRGDYTGAVKQFQAASSQTSDVAQSTVAQFRLAASEEGSGDYAAAIETYKHIAANAQSLSAMTRAYAVEDLAHMYYRYGDPAITNAIFKDDPYRSLRVAGSRSVSYRNLFDYAASLYPLAIAELYSANWYANALVAAPSLHPEYKSVVQQKMELAEEDIARTRNEPSQRNTLLQALEERAVVLGKMKRAGISGFADPQQAFDELLALYRGYSNPFDGTARLQYAVYLARQFGSEKTQVVKDILAPLNSNPSAHGISVTAFLTNERHNALGAKGNLVLLASLDPGFKTLLLSLGWTDADFK